MKAQLRGDRLDMQQQGANVLMRSSVLTRCLRQPLQLSSCSTSARTIIEGSYACSTAPIGRSSAFSSAGAAAPWRAQLRSHGAISRGVFDQQRYKLGICRAAGALGRDVACNLPVAES